ncbi:MAG: prolyl oligopeptidase family serine peptidase [Terriglobales bacterium]
MHRRVWPLIALCVGFVISGINASAEVTRADYERALGVSEKYHGLALNIPDKPVWIDGTDTFFYNKSVEGGHSFVLVDATSGTKRPAFDHARLAAALSKANGKEYKAEGLPFIEFRFADNQKAIEFRAEDERWRCELETYSCARLGSRQHEDEGLDQGSDYRTQNINDPTDLKPSPDKKWIALIQNYNVVVRSQDGSQTSVLSTDGSEGNYYSANTIVWSPDSKHLVAYRIRPGYHRVIHYIESSPATQLQPLYSSMPYTKPGDVLDLQQPVLFDVAHKSQLDISNDLFPNPFDLSRAVWWKDSRGFTFEYNQRGHQLYRVIEVDAATGKAHSLVSEESATFVDYRPLIMNQTDTGKEYRYDIADGKEMIWASERDGWEHLYLLDNKTGKVENQITKGRWVVRAVNYVDEKNRRIWFEASGMNAGEDPYLVHAYKINFDGSGLTPLPEAAGNHHLEYSSDGKYYVDIWSTINQAPTMALYEAAGNKQLQVLERGDISKLVAAGWHAPEVFVAKGRDGKTDIWGVIYKPVNFNPQKKYPVIEDIYAGPQGSFVPKSFTTRTEPLTELGFVVVQIDGMGTNNRSRAFHDVAWKNLKDAGFPDRILWHKAAAAKFPWYDISKVGIFGTSAGGQSAMGALLFHPEFYKAAVSNSGSHDNRMDKIWWNEQWMGWPIGPQYSESSNVDNAYRLQGKLMLVVGEMDKNVDPASTFQVADRLIKSGKTFDLFFVPGGGHGAGGLYGHRKLEDFFVQNILGQVPPDWNAGPPHPLTEPTHP